MDVTLPDGTTIHDIPEGTTKAQIADKLRANGHEVPQAWFGTGQAEIPDSGAKPPAKEEPSALAGIPGALLTTASSVPATLIGNLSGVVERMKGSSMEDAGKRAQEVAKKFTYEPSDAGKAALEKAGKVLDATKLAGLNPDLAATMSGMSVAARPAATVQDAASRAVRAIKNSPEAAFVETAAGAPRAAAHAMVLPEVRQLAQKATDLGISIRPDMLTDNKFMRMMGEALEKVPLSGSRVDQRQIGFNRAIMNQIGVDTRQGVKRLTPDVYDKAMNDSGAVIGDISKKTPINLAAAEPAGLDQELSNFVANAEKFETSDHARIAGNYVKELRAKAEDGVIPGETFRRINTRLGAQMRSTKDGDLKRVLSDLQDTMQDALERHVSILHPEEVDVLKTARKQYAIGKTIEPLVAKSRTGDVSPAGLMGVMTSDGAKKSLMARGRAGDMGDLARIAQAFLKEPESSGSAERYMTYGLMGGAAGAGAALEPHTAAGVYGAANAYNRLGPLITRMMLAGKRQ